MNKALKGALAATTGAVLLLGGAGTLAYWNDTITVPGDTSINSGAMTLTDTTSGGGCSAAGWVLDAAVAPSGATLASTDYLVPGDVITKSCTFTVAAKGTHLHATLTPTDPVGTGTLSSSLTVSGSFKDGGTDVTDVTEAMDGHTITATITVSFDAAADNGTQLQGAAISDYTVALAQTHG